DEGHVGVNQLVLVEGARRVDMVALGARRRKLGDLAGLLGVLEAREQRVDHSSFGKLQERPRDPIVLLQRFEHVRAKRRTRRHLDLEMFRAQDGCQLRLVVTAAGGTKDRHPTSDRENAQAAAPEPSMAPQSQSTELNALVTQPRDDRTEAFPGDTAERSAA